MIPRCPALAAALRLSIVDFVSVRACRNCAEQFTETLNFEHYSGIFAGSLSQRLNSEIVSSRDGASNLPHTGGFRADRTGLRDFLGAKMINQFGDGSEERVHTHDNSNAMLPFASLSRCFFSPEDGGSMLPMSDSLARPRGRPRQSTGLSQKTGPIRHVPEWKAAARSINSVRIRAIAAFYVARDKFGWTHQSIADELGCERQNIRNMLTRDLSFRMDFAQLLKDACGVTIEYIYDGVEALVPQDVMADINSRLFEAERYLSGYNSDVEL